MATRRLFHGLVTGGKNVQTCMCTSKHTQNLLFSIKSQGQFTDEYFNFCIFICTYLPKFFLTNNSSEREGMDIGITTKKTHFYLLSVFFIFSTCTSKHTVQAIRNITFANSREFV